MKNKKTFHSIATLIWFALLIIFGSVRNSLDIALIDQKYILWPMVVAISVIVIWGVKLYRNKKTNSPSNRKYRNLK